MGAGTWSAASYAATTGAKMSSGTSFGYSASARSRGTTKVHELLDPKIVAKSGVIESRDSVDHPNSVPIILGLDQTGSMGSIPVTLQAKFANLFDLLLLRGYVEDPQISIAAYGDTYCDPIETTVQFSNFESDNRIDEALDNLYLYGGGGGNGGETMTGIWYMMDKVVTDAWEKRNKKGYAFIVADEIALDLLPEHVKGFSNDGQPASPLTVKELAAKIQEKWEVYILLIDNYSAELQGSEKFYKNLFGNKNVLVLEDADSVTETIALTIGVREGTVDLDEAVEDLHDVGSNALAIKSSVNAIKNSGLAKLASNGSVATVNANVDLSNDSGSTRL